MKAIEYLESTGYKFQKDKDGLWEEDYVEEMRWKDLFKLMKKYATHILRIVPEKDNEPYFGWCNVEGCENECVSGGGCWRETGYWMVCGKHSQEFREGKPQPKMKQEAIDKEKGRDPVTGYLTINKNDQ